MNKKQEREYLYNKMNGRCGYCGCKLEVRWHIDHIEPLGRIIGWDGHVSKVTFPERDILENKIASCPKCNLFKSNFPLYIFRRKIEEAFEEVLKYSFKLKMAKKYGLVKETNKKVIFYFETI